MHDWYTYTHLTAIGAEKFQHPDGRHNSANLINHSLNMIYVDFQGDSHKLECTFMSI